MITWLGQEGYPLGPTEGIAKIFPDKTIIGFERKQPCVNCQARNIQITVCLGEQPEIGKGRITVSHWQFNPADFVMRTSRAHAASVEPLGEIDFVRGGAGEMNVLIRQPAAVVVCAFDAVEWKQIEDYLQLMTIESFPVPTES